MVSVEKTDTAATAEPTPRVVWKSQDGKLRIVEGWWEDEDTWGSDGGAAWRSMLTVEHAERVDSMGRKVWLVSATGDHPTVPSKYLGELLAQFGLANPDNSVWVP